MINNWYIFSYFCNCLPFVYLVSTDPLLMEFWHLWTRFSNIPNYLVFIHIYSNYINWIINKKNIIGRLLKNLMNCQSKSTGSTIVQAHEYLLYREVSISRILLNNLQGQLTKEKEKKLLSALLKYLTVWKYLSPHYNSISSGLCL